MPELHPQLLDSLAASLDPASGVALVCFALHGQVPDEAVFGFFSAAERRGFVVEELGERQWPPRCTNMPSKRSYVYARALRPAPPASGQDRSSSHVTRPRRLHPPPVGPGVRGGPRRPLAASEGPVEAKTSR
ncbi:unnamed protein product, partial [Prorocentrum cordatum]